MHTYKQGQYVILNNGEGMIHHGSICKVTKVKGDSVCLKNRGMHGQSHYFNISLILPMPKMSIKPIMRLSVEQNQWLSLYNDMTGFEPMLLEKLENGTMSFENVAQYNLIWYEENSALNFSRLSSSYHEIEENNAS